LQEGKNREPDTKVGESGSFEKSSDTSVKHSVVKEERSIRGGKEVQKKRIRSGHVRRRTFGPFQVWEIRLGWTGSKERRITQRDLKKPCSGAKAQYRNKASVCLISSKKERFQRSRLWKGGGLK